MPAEPDTAAAVTQIREGMDQLDREYRVNLAAIRQAADLTQVEPAQRMGIKQAAVSSLERRDDLLLSTLANYLAAAGASIARVVVTIGGNEVEYPLPHRRPSAGLGGKTSRAGGDDPAVAQ
ncbi:MAG: helix-turn-helix domain-containing protein [Nakamurella sp.]